MGRVMTMSDLISRESAINAVALEIASMFDVTTYDGHEIAEHALSSLPSAEAEQVTGKLKNPCDSLLTEDSEERKEQKSKLGLIRREDAIDAIDDAIDADSPQWAILRTKIGFLPSAEAVQGWIPCSERLPDVDVEVLATVDWSDVRIAWLMKGGAWETDEYILASDEILAWMPLPTPYKGGGEE